MSFLEKAIEIGLIVMLLGMIGYYLIPYFNSLSVGTWGSMNGLIVGAIITLLLVCGLMLLFGQMRRKKAGA
jgi:hypothetical protein